MFDAVDFKGLGLRGGGRIADFSRAHPGCRRYAAMAGTRYMGMDVARMLEEHYRRVSGNDNLRGP